MNSFGKEYVESTALFHWILDEKILYNNFDIDNNSDSYSIEFRYTV